MAHLLKALKDHGVWAGFKLCSFLMSSANESAISAHCYRRVIIVLGVTYEKYL
jgi:hypothetical protein